MGKMRNQQQHAKKEVVLPNKLAQGRSIDWANLELLSLSNGWDSVALEAFVVKVLSVMSHRWYTTYTEFGFKLYEKTDTQSYKLVSIKKLVEMYRVYLAHGRTSVV